MRLLRSLDWVLLLRANQKIDFRIRLACLKGFISYLLGFWLSNSRKTLGSININVAMALHFYYVVADTFF